MAAPVMRGRHSIPSSTPPAQDGTVPPPVSDARLIDLYLDMLAAERGAAANTLEAYRRDLEDFSAHLGKHGGTVAAANSDAIRDYLGRLSGRGFSAASIARRLSAIRQLYRFLYAEGNRK